MAKTLDGKRSRRAVDQKIDTADKALGRMQGQKNTPLAEPSHYGAR